MRGLARPNQVSDFDDSPYINATNITVPKIPNSKKGKTTKAKERR